MNRFGELLNEAVAATKPVPFQLEHALKGLEKITNIVVGTWDPAAKPTHAAELPEFIAVVTGDGSNCGLLSKAGGRVVFRCGQNFQADPVRKGLAQEVLTRAKVANIPAGVLPYLVMKELGCARKLTGPAQHQMGVNFSRLGAGDIHPAVIGKLQAVAVRPCQTGLR